MGNFIFTDLLIDIPADKILWQGTAAPFQFQVWIVTESKEPPLVMLAEDNGLGIWQLTAKGAHLLVETSAGVDGIILSGLAAARDRSISVNVWQRGGRRQTLVKPTVFLRKAVQTFYQLADGQAGDEHNGDRPGGCSLFGESPSP